MNATYTRTRTGLRPVGSRRTRTFDLGESKRAATEAQVGDSLTDDLLKNMTDQGLDRFSAALRARGLDFGEVSESGPTAHEPTAWLVYPIGDPSAVFRGDS